MPGVSRDYDRLVEQLAAERPDRDRLLRMERFIELSWPLLRETGVSWAGFYIEEPDAPADRRLVLGPHRDRPACSPIGLHGVCGQALVSSPRIVDDVRALGPDYIACDPRDRSEIVVALPDEGGRAVLDVDSRELAAFDDADAEGLERALRAAGLIGG